MVHLVFKKIVFISCSTIFFIGTFHSSMGYAMEVTTQSEQPSEPSSEQPSEPSSEQPSEPSNEQPSEPSSEPSSEQPSEPSSEQPSEPLSEQPSEPSSEPSSEQPSESPSEQLGGQTENGGSVDPVDNIPPESPAGFENLPVIEANVIGFRWMPVSDAAGYNIYRGETLIGNVYGIYEGEMFFEDYSVEPNSTYTYKLEAYDNSGNVSAPVTILVESLDTIPPSIPEKTKGNAIAGNEIHLIWSPSHDEREFSHYNIYLARNDETQFEVIDTRENNYYIHPGLGPNIRYNYKITGVDAAGNESDFSETLEITTPNERFGLDNFKEPLNKSFQEQTLSEFSVEYNPIEDLTLQIPEESTEQQNEPAFQDVTAILAARPTVVDTTNDELPVEN